MNTLSIEIYVSMGTRDLIEYFQYYNIELFISMKTLLAPNLRLGWRHFIFIFVGSEQSLAPLRSDQINHSHHSDLIRSDQSFAPLRSDQINHLHHSDLI